MKENGGCVDRIVFCKQRKRRDLDVDNVAYFFEFAVNSLYDQHSRKELHHRGNKKSNFIFEYPVKSKPYSKKLKHVI